MAIYTDKLLENLSRQKVSREEVKGGTLDFNKNLGSRKLYCQIETNVPKSTSIYPFDVSKETGLMNCIIWDRASDHLTIQPMSAIDLEVEHKEYQKVIDDAKAAGTYEDVPEEDYGFVALQHIEPVSALVFFERLMLWLILTLKTPISQFNLNNLRQNINHHECIKIESFRGPSRKS